MKTFLETPRHKQNIIFSKYSSKLRLNESKLKKKVKKRGQNRPFYGFYENFYFYICSIFEAIFYHRKMFYTILDSGVAMEPI